MLDLNSNSLFYNMEAVDVIVKSMNPGIAGTSSCFKEISVNLSDLSFILSDKPVNPSDKPVNLSDKPVNLSDKPVNPSDKPVNLSDKPEKIIKSSATGVK